MSRKNPMQQYKTFTVALDPETAAQVEQTMINYGVENRSAMLTIIIKAWLSMVPGDTTVYEMSQYAVKDIRKKEYEGLAEYYEKRAAEFRKYVER